MSACFASIFSSPSGACCRRSSRTSSVLPTGCFLSSLISGHGRSFSTMTTPLASAFPAVHATLPTAKSRASCGSRSLLYGNSRCSLVTGHAKLAVSVGCRASLRSHAKRWWYLSETFEQSRQRTLVFRLRNCVHMWHGMEGVAVSCQQKRRERKGKEKKKQNRGES